MQTLPDTSLSILNTLLQWVAIGSMTLGLMAAIGSVFVGNEIGRRQERAQIEAKQKIAELQPKPLKDRVLAYLNALSPQILELAKKGQREFQPRIMTDAQVADLQRLCAEDTKGQFIIWTPTTSVMIGTGGSGTQGGIRFSITDELL